MLRNATPMPGVYLINLKYQEVCMPHMGYSGSKGENAKVAANLWPLWSPLMTKRQNWFLHLCTRHNAGVSWHSVCEKSAHSVQIIIIKTQSASKTLNKMYERYLWGTRNQLKSKAANHFLCTEGCLEWRLEIKKRNIEEKYKHKTYTVKYKELRGFYVTNENQKFKTQT